jgi:hypothetical protein
MGRKRNDGKGRMGGRGPGVPNRVTSSVRTWLSGFVNNNLDLIESDFKKLQPKDRVQVFERLLQYVLPKQAAVEAQIDFNTLTEGQIDNIICSINETLTDETIQ